MSKEWEKVDHLQRKYDTIRHTTPRPHHGDHVAAMSRHASVLIDRWAAQHAQEPRNLSIAMRRELCSSGFVLGTWSGWVGTCNSLTRMLTGALLAVALDRPYVHHTNVFDRMQDHSRLGPRDRVFNASLEEAVSGVGGMAWLLPPQCIEETNRISQHWAVSPHSATTEQLRTDIVRWCAEAGATVAKSDVTAVDLRSPNTPGHGPPFGSFDIKIMMSRGAEGVCGNASRARIVVAHTDPVPNIELLAANRALPPTVLNRVRTLTTRGVNAYGMMQRALYPHGLTRVETVTRPTLAVHLRCWMNACTEHTLKRAAACVAAVVNTSGPGCSIYIASDHVGMADVLTDHLDPQISARCATLHAGTVALRPALQREVDGFLSKHRESPRHQTLVLLSPLSDRRPTFESRVLKTAPIGSTRPPPTARRAAPRILRRGPTLWILRCSRRRRLCSACTTGRCPRRWPT